MAQLGRSDHVFSTVELRNSAALPTPELAFQNAPEPLIVVAAAGGGIQSAAWTSQVLCGLRADSSVNRFPEERPGHQRSFGRLGRRDVLRALPGSAAGR